MEKTRILAIAPYDEFQTLTQQISAEFPDIQLDTYAGNLDAALEYMQSRSLEDYDVLISRGGTAKKLREALNVMVVETEVSAFDMLRSIKMAETTGKPFAVVGYENIIEPARTIVQILDLERVEIRVVTQQTVVPCLRELVAMGIRFVIGDVMTTEAAAALNLQSILVTSSIDSIRKALRTATELSHASQRKALRQMLGLDAIDQCPCGILVLDEGLRLLRSNSAALKLDLNGIKAILQENDLRETGKTEFRILQKSGDSLLDITVRRGMQAGKNYYYCYIVSTPKLPKSVGAIQIENPTPGAQTYFLFSDSTYIKPVHEMLKHATRSSDSTMIWGDVGTEKAAVARYIYRNGLYATRPMICVNCQTLTVKQWQTFTGSQTCLFNATGFTILFENIQCLSADLQGAISDYIEDTQMQKRHQLMATCTQNPNQLALDQKLSPLLLRRLSQISIHMPPLDSRKEDLSALASVYIAQLNRSLGLQVIGLTPEALTLLQNFHWYLNLDLLHKALYQLVIRTDGYYIQAEDTRQVLDALKLSDVGAENQSWLDLSKPLEEIERDIIRHVLQEENMNQSRTAKRLGIGRSTLWRKLAE